MGNYENLKQSITDVIRTNGNQEITGAVLQSTLLTIISTVGANATFAGIATPTTNPGTPDGPAFYLASESGTYTNFNGIELKDGLSVLLWNGSWSSQQVLSIDNEPTIGSDNLVKSGGVQEELALGAVYDVSAKNPTAGVNNDGKFESLSALLEDANLDTLIPVSARKGGMSIKFIQSSDNKYVQYRLIKNSWTINVDAWQSFKPCDLYANYENCLLYGFSRLVEFSGWLDADAICDFRTNCTHVVFPVKPGDEILIQRSLGSPAYYAFLKSYDVPCGTRYTLDLCENQTRKRVNYVGQFKVFAPQDANFIAFGASFQAEPSHLPLSLIINGIDLTKGTLSNITKSIGCLTELDRSNPIISKNPIGNCNVINNAINYGNTTRYSFKLTELIPGAKYEAKLFNNSFGYGFAFFSSIEMTQESCISVFPNLLYRDSIVDIPENTKAAVLTIGSTNNITFEDVKDLVSLSIYDSSMQKYVGPIRRQIDTSWLRQDISAAETGQGTIVDDGSIVSSETRAYVVLKSSLAQAFKLVPKEGFVVSCKAFTSKTFGPSTLLPQPYVNYWRSPACTVIATDECNYLGVVLAKANNGPITPEEVLDALTVYTAGLTTTDIDHDISNDIAVLRRMIEDNLKSIESLENHDSSIDLSVHSSIFSNAHLAWSDKNNPYESWPNGGVMADDNDIVIVYNSRNAHVDSSIKSDVYIRKKCVYGDWYFKKLILPHVEAENVEDRIGYGNPSCCILPDGDYLVIAAEETYAEYSRQHFSYKIIRSSDKGDTWSNVGYVNVNNERVLDECIMQVFCTSTGKLISFAGGIVNRKFIASDDEGVTWRFVGDGFQAGAEEGAFFEGTDGYIYCVLRLNQNNPALIKLDPDLQSYEILYNFNQFNFPAWYNPTSIVRLTNGKLLLLGCSRLTDRDGKYMCYECVVSENDLLNNRFSAKCILKVKAKHLADWGYAAVTKASNGAVYAYFYASLEQAGITEIYEMIGIEPY